MIYFVVCNMVAADILCFAQIRNLVIPLHLANYVIVPNFIKIGQTGAEILWFNGGLSLSWTCWARTGTTCDDYLVVSFVLQNLVGIDSVFPIIWNFQYLPVWLENAYLRPKIVFFWNFTPKIGSNINEIPKKAHRCASPRRLSHQAWKYVDGSELWRCRLGLKIFCVIFYPFAKKFPVDGSAPNLAQPYRPPT